MKIHVTQEHINKGVQRNCYKCPVALAVQEHLPKEYYCAATSNGIAIYKDSLNSEPIYRILLYSDQRFVEFIERFDLVGKYGVEPFELELNLSITNEH